MSVINKPFRLRELLDDKLAMYTSLANQKGLTLSAATARRYRNGN